jgi:hypothetical protein
LPLLFNTRRIACFGPCITQELRLKTAKPNLARHIIRLYQNIYRKTARVMLFAMRPKPGVRIVDTGT